MKQTIMGPSVPTAQICINKSRLKVYDKETSPTYYLTNGQEFQIELFNPTSDTILAKIQLNGQYISQGGLVLRPGERVFLERYIDVAKKFLFETYEVSNTAEVRNAIKKNGDFKVEFFRESKPLPNYGSYTYTTNAFPITINDGSYYKNINAFNTVNLSGGAGGAGGSSLGLNQTSQNSQSISSYYSSTNTGALQGSLTTASFSTDGQASMDSLSDTQSLKKLKTLGEITRSKTIETGRVEAGANSGQRLDYVNKSFEWFAFHIIEYAMLPVSQKVNTVADIHVAQYCTNCGAKQKAEYKFCPSCGSRK